MRPLDIPARALRTPFAGRFRDWAGFMGVHWFRLLPWTMRRWARCVRPRTFLAVVVWLTWRFCAVLSDAGLRRSEVAALTWGELMDAPDGSGRIHVVRSKKDPEAGGGGRRRDRCYDAGPGRYQARSSRRQGASVPDVRVPSLPSSGCRCRWPWPGVLWAFWARRASRQDGEGRCARERRAASR